jgi:hypothetical protein
LLIRHLALFDRIVTVHGAVTCSHVGHIAAKKFTTSPSEQRVLNVMFNKIKIVHESKREETPHNGNKYL